MNCINLTYLGREIEVEYEYTPADPEVMYYPDGSGYPGSGEEVRIMFIKYKGKEIYGFLSYSEIRDLEQLIFEQS